MWAQTKNQGSAYTFARTGAAARTETAKLSASDGAAVDQLGVSVAVAGETIVAGASGDDVGANQNQGSAYTFARTGAAARTETAKLSASDGAAGDYLGYSVAVAGETIVAGAYGDDVGANQNQGSAYTFARTGAVARTETAKLSASDGAAGDYLGVSVAVAGGTIVAGAYGDDVGANADQGSASIFFAPAPIAPTPIAPTPIAPAGPGPTPGPALKPGACANTKRGTRAADRLLGTSAGDRLLGLGGGDRLSGLAQADCLTGGRGADRLTGGAGNDRLAGGPGNDRLSGGPGNDGRRVGPQPLQRRRRQRHHPRPQQQTRTHRLRPRPRPRQRRPLRPPAPLRTHPPAVNQPGPGDAKRDRGDKALGRRGVRALKPRKASKSPRRRRVIPASAAPGEYRLLACADAT